MYLCCAATYADVVVAEKATVHRLRESSPRVVPGAVVVPTCESCKPSCKVPQG